MRVREVGFQIRNVDVFQYGNLRQIHSGQRGQRIVTSGTPREFIEFDALGNPGDKCACNFVG